MENGSAMEGVDRGELGMRFWLRTDNGSGVEGTEDKGRGYCENGSDRRMSA